MDLECYQKMYAKLCAAASDAVDILSKEGGALLAKNLLEKALADAEEIYLDYGEE